ncbi:DUF6538 domain-containing protein [Thalassobius sp. I31.1]|uniref:DUF6538 domain-containing protein n=1 Tax=Thalassobius sp. I31.1 TaxID=2109912 RepID=UPI000D19B3A2
MERGGVVVKDKNLILRGSTYSLKRRVPVEYHSVDDRETVWVSLGTDSLVLAREKAKDVWNAHLAGWEARLAGKSDDATQHFETAKALADAKGIQYLPVTQVADLPIDDLLKRVEAIGLHRGEPDTAQARAALGAVDVPKLTISEALEEYWDLTKDRIMEKSPDQVRRWKNPRIKAVKNFTTLISDKPIAEITRDDMLAFRAWWLMRVEVEGRDAGTANKDFIHFGSVLKTVNDLKRLGLNLPVDGLLLAEGKKKSRPQFTTDWIKTKLLAPGALDGLDIEARTIFLGMINTGARPSELANLQPEQIILDHDYPHILIAPVSRQLKSKNAERMIPLVGVSLDAMKQCPCGFPTYRDNPTLSDVTNAYLTKNGLRETPQHVAYSLRHSFEERLRRAKIDERLRAELFGHTYAREKYGAPKLDELTEALQVVAI